MRSWWSENVSLARDHRLRKQAEALLEAGWEVSIICRRDPGSRLAGARLHQYPPPADARSRLGFLWEYGYSWAAAALLMVKVAVVEGFDVLQISGTPDVYFTLALPFQALGKPFVLDQRELTPKLYTARYGEHGGAVLRVLRALERWSFARADHVVTVNETLRRAAVERGGVAPRRVTVVGNGPVLARTHQRAQRPALRPPGRMLACYLGMIGPQDSVDVAVRAFAHLVHVRGRRDCDLAVVGDGEARPELQRLCDELGVSDRVRFPGWADEEEAFSWLSNADVGLEPNQEPVVSPVKVMEYMAFGLPVVAFDLPETRRLAGEAACYAAPGDVEGFADALDRLLAAPDDRRDRGAVGRRRVESEVAWDHQKVRYAQVFDDLAAPTDGGVTQVHPAGREK